MSTFFIHPMKKQLDPVFSVKTYKLGNGNNRPALQIKWFDGEKQVCKKTLLLENGEAIVDYIDEMCTYHALAYNKLITFSNEFIKTPFKSVHNIITKRFHPQNGR